MSYVVNENKRNGNISFSSVQTLYGIMRIIQLFSFIYSFISFCYWALMMIDVNLPVFIRFLFELPYIFVRIFGYIPRGTETDFTGAIVGTAFLIIGFLANYTADIMEQSVISAPSVVSKRKNVKNYTSQVNNTNYSNTVEVVDTVRRKFIFLLEVKISEVEIASKSTHFDANKLKKRICDAIIDNLNLNKLDQCGFYKKNLFIVYKDFSYIDNFVYYIKVTLDSLAKEFSNPQIMIDFNVAFSIISNLTQLENELLTMDMILNLNIMNEFVTTAKFKTAYENQDRTKYILVTKGTYNLSRNLSINNNQDIFSIREKHL